MLFLNAPMIRLTVGYGENHFTMSHGSFSYDEEILWKKELQFKRTQEAAKDALALLRNPGKPPCDADLNKPGLTLIYEDAEEDKEYLMFFCEEDDQTVVFRCLGVRLKNDPERPVPAEEVPNRWWITIPSDPSEHFYGGGETYSEWDLKGLYARVFTAEHQNSKRITEKLQREAVSGKDPKHKLPFSEYESYYVQPTVMSSKKYFIHCDTVRFMTFDFTKPQETTLYLQEQALVTIAQAETFPALGKKLQKLLGGQRKLPSWVYDGVIAAVQRGSEEVDRKLQHLFDAGVPTVGVWCQDWCGCRNNTFGYQVMWNWEYDRDLYPNLPEKIKEWRSKGVRFLGYINPFIALERNLYPEAHEKGYLVKNAAGEDYLVTITVFPAAMIDFTNPEAYNWYKNIIKKNMIGAGLSGWMADFGEYLPTDAVLYNGEPAEDWHNRWPAIWAQMNREAVEECGMEDEIFFFMRAGFTGSVKDSLIMWTGDQHVDWSLDDGIGSVIPATLSLAVCGFGMAHSDVGGYTTNDLMKRSEELMMRWEEMNVFSPVMRFHEGNQPWNNVQFDASAALLQHLKECADLHVKLAPYLKKCVEELVTEALPVQRPLFWHYDEEEAYTISDEYLLGRDMLVAPVIEEGAVSREVWLPEDNWEDYWTGQKYGGGKYVIDAPLGKIPVFVRAKA